MHCESCSAEITSKMKGALKTNTCPFCGEKIMPDMKAEQYMNLVGVLDQTSFTNRQDVDAQIRDKVATLLVSNFLFKKLDLPEVKPDIIVLGEEDESTPTPTKHHVEEPKQQKSTPTKVSNNSNAALEQQLESAPTRSVAEAAVSRPRTAAPKPPSGKGLSARDYAAMQNDTYSSPDAPESNVDLSDIDGLTPEEIMTTFPELTLQDIEGIKDRALSKLQQQQQLSMPQKGLTGKGIRRTQ